MTPTPGEVDDPASALRDREERLRAALRASGTSTYRWDVRTHAMEWDENLGRVLGLAPREAPCTLESFLRLVHPDDRDAVAEACRRCAREGADFDMEYRVCWPDGSVRWLCDKGKAYRDAEGGAVHVTGACVDVSDQRRVQQALRDEIRRGDLERLTQARSDVMAILSHELRTPLTAVIGYTELLEMGIPEPIGPEAHAHVERIHLSALHLQQLIEEILTFSRLDSGREQVSVEEVEIPLLLREVAAIVEPLARQKGLTFTIHADDAPPGLRTDPRKVRQILLNLVGNAVKFTGAGSVELRVDAAGEGIRFRVRDTGPGIRAEQIHLIFEPFWQADSPHTRTSGGTGLGLSITRGYVDMLGGRITVESDAGRGTTFTVLLPAAPAAALDAPAE